MENCHLFLSVIRREYQKEPTCYGCYGVRAHLETFSVITVITSHIVNISTHVEMSITV